MKPTIEQLKKLKNAGGNDASLFLLEKICEMECKMMEMENKMEDEMKKRDEKIDNKIEKINDKLDRQPNDEAERIAMKLAIKIADVQKGDKGDSPTDEELLALIKPLIPKPIKGKDGKTPTAEEILEIIRPLIPEVKDGATPTEEELKNLIKKVIPEEETPEETRDKLQTLKEGERLHIKYIDGVKDTLKLLKEDFSKIFVGQGGNIGNKIKIYDLSDSLDGSTKTFNIPANTTIVTIQSSSFPNAFRPTTDYTNTMTTITFTNEIEAGTVLAAGQTLIIVYVEA